MIIVRIWEGLGNQMFQYAYARALKAKGIDVRLDLNKAYDSVFAKYKHHMSRENSIQNFRLSIPAIDMSEYGKYDYIMQDSIARKVIFWMGSHAIWKYKFYEEEVQEYSRKSAKIRGSYYVKGWFQSERYFQDIRSDLLKEFTPRKKISISKELREMLTDPESVSIHVRRGDYVRIHQELNRAYFNKAVNLMRKEYKEPCFLVFSDDLEWTKKNLEISGRCIYVNENRKLEDYEELFIMSRCKSNIISNSTFGWWAAWLNTNKSKIVIAPKKWMQTQGDIVPRDWIVL